MKSILVQDIESAVIEWAGEAPRGSFVWTGKWVTAWGKNNKFRFWGAPDRQVGVVYNHVDQVKQCFHLVGYGGRVRRSERSKVSGSERCRLAEPVFKLYSKEAPASHPYFVAKGITSDGLDVRWDGDRVVIPIYSTSGDIVSYQTIGSDLKNPKNKLFAKGYTLPPGHHFKIGEVKRRVFVCEGFATGVSIHRITKECVYCAFSRGNLDDVVQYALNRHVPKEVVLCVDNDGMKTHKSRHKFGPRFRVLRPECPSGMKKADFNDVQDNIYALEMLSNLVDGPCMSGVPLAPRPVNHIGHLNWVGGKLNIISALPGCGKSTLTIKTLVDVWRDTGRPFGYFGKENDYRNLLYPFVHSMGGDIEKTMRYPVVRSKERDPSLVTAKEAYNIILGAGSTGELSAIFIDHIGLFIEDEIKNKGYERVILPMLENLHNDTALVVTSHLTKNTVGRDLIHHIRGGSELVGLAKYILYIRKAQENKRIVVKLKDSYSGVTDDGWLVHMPSKKEMVIKDVFGSCDGLLKKYGTKQDDLEEVERRPEHVQEQVRRVKEHLESLEEGSPELKVGVYYQWALGVLGLEKGPAKNRLYLAGYKSVCVDRGKGLWVIKKDKLKAHVDRVMSLEDSPVGPAPF